ncbi:MAG TPA: transcriptional regulator [Actinocatenispora sp.]
MHPPEKYASVIRLRDSGTPISTIARHLDVPKGTVAHWLYGVRARQMAALRKNQPVLRCAGCTGDPADLPDTSRYASLLGQYLGDGHLVTSARVPVLRVYCATVYPDILDECRRAMLAVRAKSVSVVARGGCMAVQSYSTHWPCLFPQHGPGMKHQRRIELADWQQTVVDAHPRPLLRGLIHADGCRSMNNVTVRGRSYGYPRYLFANESGDILRICGDALDRVGARWRFNRRNSISVARRESVALLDTFVGAKS